MKITLTYHEGRAVIDAVPARTGHHLHETRRHTWGRSHIYLLPPVGWRGVMDAMRDAGFGERGGRRKSDSFYGALAKIVDAVKTWELHPAFRRASVVGYDKAVIPAFTHDGGLSPYPDREPVEFVLLHPRHTDTFGFKATTWGPDVWGRSPENPCHSSHFHLEFRVLD